MKVLTIRCISVLLLCKFLSEDILAAGNIMYSLSVKIIPYIDRLEKPGDRSLHERTGVDPLTVNDLIFLPHGGHCDSRLSCL